MQEQQKLTDTVGAAVDQDTAKAFDDRYMLLREKISSQFLNAFALRRPLLRFIGARLGTDTLMSIFKRGLNGNEVELQDYNCHACFNFIRDYSNTFFINDDGSVCIPVKAALEEVFADEIDHNDAKWVNWLRTIEQGNAQAQENLTTTFCVESNLDKASNVRKHLFGFNDEAFRQYKEEKEQAGVGVATVAARSILHRYLTYSPRLAELASAYTSIESHVRVKSSIFSASRFIALCEYLNKMPKSLRFAYLCALTAHPDYGWLRGMESSCAGVVTEAFDDLVRDDLDQFKSKFESYVYRINSYTAGEVYKHRSDIVNEQTLDATVDYLKRKAPTVLQRRFLTVSDIADKLIWIEPKTSDQAHQQDSELPLDPLEAALGKVRQNIASTKNDAKEVIDNLQKLENTKREMSIDSFISNLDDVAGISVVGISAIRVCFATASIDGNVYPETITYNAKTLKEDANILTCVDPVRLTHIFDNPETANDALVVRGITVKTGPTGQSGHVLLLNNLEPVVRRMFGVNGSMIIGPIINSNIKGMTSSIVALSKNHPMPAVPENEQLVAGIWMTEGLWLHVTMKDGRERKVTLAQDDKKL